MVRNEYARLALAKALRDGIARLADIAADCRDDAARAEIEAGARELRAELDTLERG